jgi:hypothetical protein
MTSPPPPVVRVVVHPDGAVVYREGFAVAADGRVTVDGLPYLLDPTSVRLEAVGVGEVEVDLDPTSLAPPGPPPVLEALEAATARVRRLEAEREGLRTERAQLARIAPAFVDEPERARPTTSTLAAWGRVDAALDETLAALDARLVEVDRAHRDAEEARASLASRAAHESGQGAWRHLRPTRRVRARVASEGTVRVVLSYVVPGAAWSPAYVLDADLGLTRGSFALRALVVQATGEDWSNVALALSTAPVGRRVDLPVLRSLRLSARQERPTPAFRELPADLDSLFPEPPPPPPPPPAELALEDEVEPPVTPMPQATFAPPPAPLPQRKAASPMGGLADAVGGAFGAVYGESGALEEAAAAPSAAPSRARAKNAPARSPGRAGPSLESTLQVDELDYGALRLGAPDAPPGRRGRLLPGAEDARLAELGAGDEGRSWFLGRASELRAACERVRDRAWPPHHVVAGPIQGNDRVFTVDGRVDVPADGHPHSVAVTAWPAGLSVWYRAVPRLDPRAFRMVDVRLEGASGSLLPGPVDVLVGGRLELTTPWSGSAGRGQLRIGLGAEDRLKVARNVRYKEESAGLFGGSRRLATQIDVQVASALPHAARLELLERIPLPAEKESLTVEITESSPVAEAWKGEVDGPLAKGARLQRLDLAPGGEARATLSYAITLGAKDELVGGDRRG